MDRLLRAEIVAEVRRAMEESQEMYGEQWVSGKELCKQVQMFTEDWLEKYGDILPHKEIKVTTLDGRTRRTRKGYAKLEILENIRNGVYDDLKLLR